LTKEPLWYKDAIIYELHVKSFFDFNDDGIGDFKGLTQKLDYFQELGVTALWLLPFYPSPLKDDGYDIADYFRVHPDYGTLADFKRFLKQAHKRDIRVITELVINHTSDQHRWFKRARKAKPNSIWRDFYVWSDTPEKYKDARIIFTDFENSNWSWDPVAQAYYWHRFYDHQPDLNFDNPRVREEIFRVLDFWFDMGVDGLRLDAVPYLIEREGTNCENLPETHQFLKELRAHVDQKFTDKMLLAEANQWPEDAATYFGNGDECHMAFHFPVMPRLFMALRMEDSFPIFDILDQSSDIPETCQWAMFLRNHDELTLEMVTDEERDYMYKSYAQDPRARINLGIRRRLAPLLDNNRKKIELMNALLFSLPGTPVLYYGDEIGMGDNYYLGDRDGVRTPMQWTPDRNAGFSKASPHKLHLPVVIDAEYHYAGHNIENQRRNPTSLWWWMSMLIAVRKRFKAFGRGTIEFPPCDNPKVFTMIRRYEDEIILVVANLSRFCQVAHPDLSEYNGCVPEEIFSGNNFPEITPQPYTLTLGPNNFFWFVLREQPETTHIEPQEVPQLNLNTTWRNFTTSNDAEKVTKILKDYLKTCRWFAGKAKPIRRIRIADHMFFAGQNNPTQLLLLKVYYTGATQESYAMPMGFATKETALKIMQESPQSVIAHVKTRDGEGIFFEAIHDEKFRNELLDIIARRGKKRSGKNMLVATRSAKFRKILREDKLPLDSRVLKVEQSNTSINYDETFFLKLYRKLEKGVNPDMEITRRLTEDTDFEHFPSYAGGLEWRTDGQKPLIVAMLTPFIASQEDAWAYSLDAIENYYAQARTEENSVQEIPEIDKNISGIDYTAIPEKLRDLIGPYYLENIALLGQRTAQMHLALASLKGDKDVLPESFSMLYQRSVYQSTRALLRKVFAELKSNIKTLPEEYIPEAEKILSSEKEILTQYKNLYKRKISAMKIRIHGDYHLGQVLFTGKDFIIIDFEGEPARPLSERRLKRSPLRDIAGMIRSFHYAAYGSIFLRSSTVAEDLPKLEKWANRWYASVSGVFLNAYLKTTGDAGFIPTDQEDFNTLFNTFMLDKAVYELGYELNNRPHWTMIPIRGIKNILEITATK